MCHMEGQDKVFMIFEITHYWRSQPGKSGYNMETCDVVIISSGEDSDTDVNLQENFERLEILVR